MAFNFREFIIGNLPSYIIDNDSYKDTEDKGLFERYLAIFSDYLDEELYPSINDYLNIIDASVCDEKFLNHLSDVLGNPPDVFKNDEQYRNLLSYIVSVYKIKGTKAAYELFFSILGYEIEIEEIIPDPGSFIYDTTNIYDLGLQYDGGICETCSYYSIKFFSQTDGIENLNFNTLKLLETAIEFNEPINAKLSNFTYILQLEDSLNIAIEDTDLTLVGEIFSIYDSGEIYDENLDILRSSTSIKSSTGIKSSTVYL